MRSEQTGAPVREGVIPLSEPSLGGNEWKYVKECLDTGWVSSSGPFVDRFERDLTGRVGVRHAVATTSGTAALHVALLVAGVQPDDEVLIPALTFIAPANAVRYVGAWPVFVDVERDYWQMDPLKVRDFLLRECRWHEGALYNRTNGRRVRAIVPVHLLGHPCDLVPLVDLARRFELRLIEDATQSLGARYRDQAVGRVGDLACFSFNGNKLVTTGGGGMIATNDEALAAQARYLTTQAKLDGVEYVHGDIGYNYRLSNVQAAIGCAQLERLDDFVAEKRRIASTYGDALGALPGVSTMAEAPWAWSTYWLSTIRVDGARARVDRRKLMERFEAVGVQTRPLWQPLHRSPAHRGAQAYRCEAADEIQAEALSLPSSVGLREADQRRVIAVLVDAVGGRL